MPRGQPRFQRKARSYTDRVTILLRPEELARLQRACANVGCPMSELARTALEGYLEALEARQTGAFRPHEEEK